MRSAAEILDSQYLEMRWRLLSLTADLDRIQRAAGGEGVLQADPRLKNLRRGAELLLATDANRAERFQQLLSDQTPPPAK